MEQPEKVDQGFPERFLRLPAFSLILFLRSYSGPSRLVLPTGSSLLVITPLPQFPPGLLRVPQLPVAQLAFGTEFSGSTTKPSTTDGFPKQLILNVVPLEVSFLTQLTMARPIIQPVCRGAITNIITGITAERSRAFRSLVQSYTSEAQPSQFLEPPINNP